MVDGQPLRTAVVVGAVGNRRVVVHSDDRHCTEGERDFRPAADTASKQAVRYCFASQSPFEYHPVDCCC